ncbi:MAG TPA: hypothetical protein VLA09_01200 [Longimicrobiales bacterium]|nr:hypothetical protein [Longimicrobiales bacterium]
MLKKILVFFLVGLCAWNVTKIPYYIAFDTADTADAYVQHGLEGSINLGHWVDGYHGTKLKTPAVNFLLVHNVVGITVLIMMALSLAKQGWRRKYGRPYFAFAIVLGVHTLPAAWMMDAAVRKYLFTATCAWVIGAAIWGFFTLRSYDADPERSERHLLIQYALIALGAYGAGFAEFYQIGKNTVSRFTEGIWPDFGPLPHPLVGQTPYDVPAVWIGYAVFALWVAIVWVIWPWRVRAVALRARGPSAGQSSASGE